MSTPPAMSCTEAEPLLPLVAEGSVDPDSEPGLFAHLARCDHCQRQVAQHDLVTMAVAAAAAAASARPSARRPLAFPRWVAWAALVAVACGGVAWVLMERPIASQSAAIAVAAPGAPAAPAHAVAVASTPSTSAPAADVPDVQWRILPDGRRVWLVRQGDGWIVVSPSHIDAAGATGGGSDIRAVVQPVP